MLNTEKRLAYWEARAKQLGAESDYYRKALSEAHAIIGRIIQQFSERWDEVVITEFTPTFRGKIKLKQAIAKAEGKGE